MSSEKEISSKELQMISRQQAIRKKHEKQVCMQFKMISDLMDYLQPIYGDGVVSSIVSFLGENRQKEMEQVASKLERNSLDDFIKMVWEPLKQQGYEFTIERTDNKVEFNVTKCPGVEKAEEWGYMDNAYHIICASDPYIVEGFNSNIGFTRTKTLMQGHDCCNHCYFIKE